MRIFAQKQKPMQKAKSATFAKPSLALSGQNRDMRAILNLQRTVGNRAFGQLVSSGILQTKLEISRPNDKYEQEADHIADQLMSMTESQGKNQSKPVEHMKDTKVISKSNQVPSISKSPHNLIQRILNNTVDQACAATRQLPIINVQGGPINFLLPVYTDSFSPSTSTTINVQVESIFGIVPIPVDFRVALFQCSGVHFLSRLGGYERNNSSGMVSFQRNIQTDRPREAEVAGLTTQKRYYLKIENRSLDPLNVSISIT